jgi:RNA polymerase sigma-70 factor, ECF subfamily
MGAVEKEGAEPEELEVLDALYRNYAEGLTRNLGARIGDRELAKDIVHESFILVLRHLDGIDPESSQWAWLTRIVNRQASAYFRRQPELPIESAGHNLADHEPTPEEVLLIQDGVKELLRDLRPRPRRLLIERGILELTFQEIAEKEGITLAAAEQAVLRARKKARETERRRRRRRRNFLVFWRPIQGGLERIRRTISSGSIRFNEQWAASGVYLTIGAPALLSELKKGLARLLLGLLVVVGVISPKVPFAQEGQPPLREIQSPRTTQAHPDYPDMPNSKKNEVMNASVSYQGPHNSAGASLSADAIVSTGERASFSRSFRVDADVPNQGVGMHNRQEVVVYCDSQVRELLCQAANALP